MDRLDVLLVRKGCFTSREKARRAVMAGIVQVDGQRVDKPGTSVPAEAELRVVGPKEPYVSRAGRKLAQALQHFHLSPRGLVCLDVGASTGGFTDCLLQNGASKVYAVDVGYGQLDHGLRTDPRVLVMERVNARYLQVGDLPEVVDLITVDVSFISVLKVVPALIPLGKPGAHLLVLIKPQFEAGRRQVGKGGIVRDPGVRREVIRRCEEGLVALKLEPVGIVDSEVVGAKGNREALGLFKLPEAPSSEVLQ